MSGIRFSDDDATLLWCMGDEDGITGFLRRFMFINRCAAPPIEEFQSFLRKAYSTGIVDVQQDRLAIKIVFDREWSRRIHAHDGEGRHEFDDMECMSEWLTATEWPVIREAKFEITPDFYRIPT